MRSSALHEDTAAASAAGQYESVLAVHGPQAVADAVLACWRSARTARVAGYWARMGTGGAVGGAVGGGAEPDLAVLVQRLVDADVSGVLFTPARPGDPTRVEAAHGLGLAVVHGTVTPDTYLVAPGGSIRRTVGDKVSRVDRDRAAAGLTTREVPDEQRSVPVLDDATVARLASLGGRVAAILGGAQDVEWAVAGGEPWILQARPVTVTPPLLPSPSSAARAGTVTGTPGARGVATGRARVVRSVSEFSRVTAGDIVVCAHTDPAWTPLFAVAAGVVTETGGVLSHAAIVAREYGIPAVLGVAHATSRLRDGARITLDGAAGTVAPS